MQEFKENTKTHQNPTNPIILSEYDEGVWTITSEKLCISMYLFRFDSLQARKVSVRNAKKFPISQRYLLIWWEFTLITYEQFEALGP